MNKSEEILIWKVLNHRGSVTKNEENREIEIIQVLKLMVEPGLLRRKLTLNNDPA